MPSRSWSSFSCSLTSFQGCPAQLFGGGSAVSGMPQICFLSILTPIPFSSLPADGELVSHFHAQRRGIICFSQFCYLVVSPLCVRLFLPALFHLSPFPVFANPVLPSPGPDNLIPDHTSQFIPFYTNTHLLCSCLGGSRGESFKREFFTKLFPTFNPKSDLVQ